VPIWNRFQYNWYLPGPKCNADFGASFRCLSQMNTVARQFSRGTFKTAPSPNVNFGLCRSRSLVFPLQQSYDSAEQPAFHRASTNRASHQFNRENAERYSKRSKVWLYFAQKDSNNATCGKCNKTIACKGGSEGKHKKQISNRRLKTKRRCQLYLTYG